VSRFMLDVEDAGALLWEDRPAPHDRRNHTASIQVRTNISAESREFLKYSRRSIGQDNIEVVDEQSTTSETMVSVVLLRRSLALGVARRNDDHPGESSEGADYVEYTGISATEFAVRLHVDEVEFANIERRIAEFGMPKRVFIEFDTSGGLWRTEAASELPLRNWSLFWPITPPQFSNGKPDRRPPTRDQIDGLATSLGRILRWTQAICWLVVVVSIYLFVR